jgi:Fe-S-cluster containining protein
MLEAQSALTFRCTACGNCCRTLRVAVTAADVARLVAATGRAASDLVQWLSPDEVDMTGEPQSFVELRAGRRLMVLAHAGQGCALLSADGLCSAYAARPLDCRTFPFDFGDSADVGGTRSLALLPLVALRRRDTPRPLDCDYASDGQQDARELAEQDQQRWRDLAAFQSVVARWNRWASHRRRLGHALGNSDDFLRFALERCTTGESERALPASR